MLWPVIAFSTDYTARRLFSSCRSRSGSSGCGCSTEEEERTETEKQDVVEESYRGIQSTSSTETKWQCGQSDSRNSDTAESGQKTYTGL